MAQKTQETNHPQHSASPAQQDILKGLSSSPKILSSKYLYDDKGSQIFDQICELDEYYATRTESALLKKHAGEVIDLVKPDNIIELGSGSSLKVRFLLDACGDKNIDCQYCPMDVCPQAVESMAGTLGKMYPWLKILALTGDYSKGFETIDFPKGTRNIVLFMGSTIGNFPQDEAIKFLKQVRQMVGENGLLLMGMDRIKDQDILHAAYNDAQGLTAAFNLNALQVVNEQMDADFDLDRFQHKAFYNEPQKQIEMHLVSEEKHSVYLKSVDTHIHFEVGETIHTEVSRKFSDDAIEALFRESGFSIVKHYTPDNQYFSLVVGKVDDRDSHCR